MATAVISAAKLRVRRVSRAGAEPSWKAYALIAPAGILYAVFQLVPIVGAVVLSFTSWNGINLADIKFVGVANYQRLLTDGLFWSSFGHNVFVAVMVFFFMSVGS